MKFYRAEISRFESASGSIGSKILQAFAFEGGEEGNSSPLRKNRE